MKLETKNTEILGSLSNDSKKAKISEQHLNKLWAMIENPYKNSIGSIVREYVSNCFDSHAEAGITDAVMVKFTKEEDGFYVSFIDVGVGISEDRMDKIFLNVFATTKDTTDDMIGAFGMGSKSGLSYQSHFYINTHVDGTTYNYIYRKGQIEPELDLLDSYQEDKRNGTEIKLKIKSESDLMTFIRECNRQLYYFENVVFDYGSLENYLNDCDYDSVKVYLNNDFKIHEGKNYKVRINNNTTKYKTPFNRIHICNGPVAYPIDFNNIAVDHNLANINIGLKFNIGELDVIQTREDVRYTDKTIKAITAKLEAAKQELIAIANQTPEVIHNNYKDYLANKHQKNIITLGKDDYTFIIQSNILPNTKHYLKGFYKIDKIYNPEYAYQALLKGIDISDSINHTESGSVRINKSFQNCVSNTHSSFYPHTTLNYSEDSNCGTIIIKKPEINYSVKINKQLVFKDNLIGEDEQLPVFIDNRGRRNLDWFIKHLQLKTTNKANWRKLIILFNKIEEKWLTEKLKDCYNIIWYDDYKLDEKWYSNFAKANRKEAEKRDTTKMSFIFRNQYSYKDGVWDNQNYSIDELIFKQGKIPNRINSKLHNKILIFIEKDNKSTLKLFNNILSNDKHIVTAALAPRNYDKLNKYVRDNKITNVVSWYDFVNNKYNIKMQFLRKMYKYYLMQERFNKIYTILDFGGAYTSEIQYLFPKVSARLKEYNEVQQELTREFNWLNTTSLKRYFTRFGNELEEVENYVREHDKNFIENLEELEEFYNIFTNVVPRNGYYTDNNITSQSFYTFLYYYKPYSTFSLLNPEIRVPNDEEFKLLVDVLEKNSMDNSEKVILKYIIHFYLIKNRLPLTYNIETLKEIKNNIK